MNATELLPEEIRDTTDREGAERQRDFFKGIIEQLVTEFPEPIGVADQDGVVVGWNTELGELTGVSPDDAVGKTGSEALGMGPDDEVLTEEVARMGETIVEDEPRTGETDDGDLWAVKAQGFPLRNPETGGVIGSFQANLVVTDIVEEKQALETIKDRITNEVVTATQQLTESLSESEAYAQTVRTRIEEQAEDIDTIQRDVTTISSESGSVSQRGQRINSHCSEMSRAATDASEAVETVSTSLHDASDLGKEVKQLSENLEQRASEITEVTETIDDIAEQTNLLALNANIEAARAQAGQNNGGFGVVANEVKSLATQSQEEVQKVRGQIDDLRDTVTQTVTGIAELQDKIEGTVGTVSELTERHDDITEHISEVDSEVTGLAESMETQTEKIERLQREIEQFTERTTDISGSISDMAEETTEQSTIVTELHDSVQELESNLELE